MDFLYVFFLHSHPSHHAAAITASTGIYTLWPLLLLMKIMISAFFRAFHLNQQNKHDFFLCEQKICMETSYWLWTKQVQNYFIEPVTMCRFFSLCMWKVTGSRQLKLFVLELCFLQRNYGIQNVGLLLQVEKVIRGSQKFQKN